LPLQFQAQVSEAQVREATAGIFWAQLRQPKLLTVLGAFLLFGQLLLSLVMTDGNLVLRAALALLMLLSVLGVAWVASRYYQGIALRNFERIQAAPVRVRLDEDAYRFEAVWGQGSLPWERFQSLWRLEQVWVLLQHAQDGASVLLPAESLAEDARAFLEQKIAAVNGELR
jgi:hypothetical protein